MLRKAVLNMVETNLFSRALAACDSAAVVGKTNRPDRVRAITILDLTWTPLGSSYSVAASGDNYQALSAVKMPKKHLFAMFSEQWG
jgi:hypothetical protein